MEECVRFSITFSFSSALRLRSERSVGVSLLFFMVRLQKWALGRLVVHRINILYTTTILQKEVFDVYFTNKTDRPLKVQSDKHLQHLPIGLVVCLCAVNLKYHIGLSGNRLSHLARFIHQVSLLSGSRDKS